MEQQQKDSVHEAAPLAGQGSQVTQSGESATGEGSARMNPEVKARWVAALRSGEYQQGSNSLVRGGRMCCLGVLCDLHAMESGGSWHPLGDGTSDYLGQRNYLPEAVELWAGLPDDTGAFVVVNGLRDRLPNHNDDGRTFAQIADAIEEQL